MLAALRAGADVSPEVDSWSEAGAVDRLERLGHALVTAADPPWAFDPALDRVLRLLATVASPERAAAAARLAQALPVHRVRRVAALLAAGQQAPVLLGLLADLPPGERATELGACLLHEMVLRGLPVPEDTWRRRLAGHPLGDLPLHPLPGEGPRPAARPLITAPGVVPVATRRTTPADATAAVGTWLKRSNGRAEAAVFTLASPLAPADVGIRTLESLGLDSLAGDGLALRPADLADVVAVLFTAAATGGAYDHGLGGAYGRAAAWRSVTVLAGGRHEDGAWWTFEAANDWFRRLAWDVGVVCLRPGGRSLAVLAATDND